MKFWAIAYKYQEDVFYNIEKYSNTTTLTEKCLLPSKDLAEQIIDEQLSASFLPVEIELITLNENGIYTWSRSVVEDWDIPESCKFDA